MKYKLDFINVTSIGFRYSTKGFYNNYFFWGHQDYPGFYYITLLPFDSRDTLIPIVNNQFKLKYRVETTYSPYTHNLYEITCTKQ
jgi:hypothetical protein